MKTRWEFKIETNDLEFERDHNFEGTASLTPVDNAELEKAEFDFRLELHMDAKKGSISKRTGRLNIILRGAPEENKEFAYLIAESAVDKISLHHGNMRVHWGYISAERIAETEQEAIQIGDQPYWIELNMREASPQPVFNPDTLSKMNLNSQSKPLLRQFNSAKNTDNPVDRFLGFFKVLELAYCENKRNKLVKTLSNSDVLFKLTSKIMSTKLSEKSEFSKQQFDELIKEIFKIRNNCAHLRRKSGYSPGDPRLNTEVEPYLSIIERLAYESVLNKL